MRTWAPIGQTPILEFSFNWQKLSAIAGITSRSFCFRLHGGAIRTAQIIAFLGQLRRFLPGKILIIWDRAQIHRSLRVRRYMETHRDRIATTYLPPYAPELNPAENIWEYLRSNKLANTVYDGYDDIVDKASDAWMFFAEDKDRIASITTRDWAQVNL